MQTRSGTAVCGEGAAPVEIFYEDLGDPAAPAGAADHGRRRAAADVARRVLRAAASTRGYRVIRFDHRDTGLSTKMRGLRADGSVYPRVLRYVVGRTSPVPYTLIDMAEDVEGSARPPRHRTGARRRRVDGRDDRAGAGGQPPERVRSLGVIMSSTGTAAVGDAAVASDQAGVRRASQGRARRGQAGDRGAQHLASSTVRTSFRRSTNCAAASRNCAPAATTRRACCASSTRSWAPAACCATPGASPRRRSSSTARTTRWCGRATAATWPAAIPGARFVVVDGMGHDLPEPVWRPIVEALTENFAANAYSSRQMRDL